MPNILFFKLYNIYANNIMLLYEVHHSHDKNILRWVLEYDTCTTGLLIKARNTYLILIQAIFLYYTGYRHKKY